MQVKFIFALAIYIGSYLPLSLILLAQDLNLSVISNGLCSIDSITHFKCVSPLKNTIISLSAVMLCVIGFIFTIFAMRTLPGKRYVEIVESKHVPADLINYTIPYIVSFISIDYSDSTKIIGFIVFFSWIFWITFMSGQLMLNPALAALGWKLFEVKFKYPAGDKIFVGRMLSRIDIDPGQDYLQGDFQDVMIMQEKEIRDEQ